MVAEDEPSLKAENQPLARFAVEGLVIVVSILLAFAIDASWQNQQERAERADLVEALVLDFETTRTRLASSIEYGEAALARSDSLFSLVGQGREVSIDSLKFLAGGLFLKIDFEPALSTYESAVGSGELRGLQSRTFLEATAEFRRARDFYEDTDAITTQLFYLGPTLEIRRELGSLGVLEDDRHACRSEYNCPYPAAFDLGFDEFLRFLGRRDVYGALENVQNANLNIVLSLRDMDEAAGRVLQALDALR